jgi:glutamate synthase domain-containing protein 3
MRIDAKGMHYRQLNEIIHGASADGVEQIDLYSVLGHRYIGTGIVKPLRINIHGTPGSDLGAFMDGPLVEVFGSGQDAVGNTMGSGEIVIHGHTGNVTGLAMSGGRIFVEGHVGYRVGIHIKGYRDRCPSIVIGGCAGDFLGEYMAGGRITVLGIGRNGRPLVGDYVGTGMHGGVIYIRGPVKKTQTGREVDILPLDDQDWEAVRTDVEEFARRFEMNAAELLEGEFAKLAPVSHRPYGRAYVY